MSSTDLGQNFPILHGWKRLCRLTGSKFYYWFARFPVVKSVNSRDGRHRVEFMDVRFLLPGLRMPFVYYVEFDNSGKVQSEGFMRDGKSQKVE